MIASLILLFASVAYAENVDLYSQPTYKTKAYVDSAGKPSVFFTGVVPHVPHIGSEFQSDAPIPAAFNINDYIKTVMKQDVCPILDQKSCGSCVYFATTATLCQLHRARGKTLPVPAPQWIMDCAQRQWMCNGSIFDYVAKGIVAKGGAAIEDDYPYRASNQSCKSGAQVKVPVKSHQMIEATAQAIGYQIAVMKKPVAVTVGADNAFTQYRSGIYNRCTRTGTNHQVVAEAYDCETSTEMLNGQKVCKFNSKGYPVNGDGWVLIRNSWGSRWGDNGYIKMRWLDSSGNKCNNIAEEAGVLETGDPPLPPKPPTPVTFNLETASVSLKVTVQPEANYSPDDAKQMIQTALSYLGE